jgi:hypothetical protein
MVYIATMMAVLGRYSAGEGQMKAQWMVGVRPLGGLLGELFGGASAMTKRATSHSEEGAPHCRAWVM